MSVYRGRFAPSPTGPLHFGSLVAAVGSYLNARQAGGEWLVRIEDLDPPRVVPGATEQILVALEGFGFEWSGPVVRQSERSDLYAAAAEKLRVAGHTFECSCSRTEIQAVQSPGAAGDDLYYPGWCRSGTRAPDRARAVRFRTTSEPISFLDDLQGRISANIEAESGDFVIRRRDGLYAYQLAVVVDDGEQQITHVVRGADLLSSTPRQILLQRALGLPSPGYAHLPVATDSSGIKLSKSAGAAALDVAHPGGELWRALHFLRQAPPVELRLSSLATLWGWAFQHWRPSLLRGLRHAALDPSSGLGIAARMD